MPKIICAQCKSIEDVEEEPSSLETVLCSTCQQHARKAPDSSRSRSRRKRSGSVPRKKHGTRVMLPITCVECGESDTLDYVPKGADLDDVLCRSCAREEFGTDSDWARIERDKDQDRSERKEWKFKCDECGRTDYLPFEPKPDRHYECNMCRLDHDTPSHERLEGRKQAAGGVFIRRNSQPEE